VFDVRGRDTASGKEKALGENVNGPPESRRAVDSRMILIDGQMMLAASLMLTTTTDLHDVFCILAVLAAIFIIVRDRTTTTRMRALLRVIVCHDDTSRINLKAYELKGASLRVFEISC
jgi:hypothetical protein